MSAVVKFEIVYDKKFGSEHGRSKTIWKTYTTRIVEVCVHYRIWNDGSHNKNLESLHDKNL